MRQRIRRWGVGEPTVGELTVEAKPTAELVERQEESNLKWYEAFLTKDMFRYPVFGVAIQTDTGTLYGSTRYGLSLDNVKIDIPIRDDTPEEALANEFYLGATFFGEIDPERFEALAIDSYRIDTIMAYLNRKTFAGNQEGADWFYESVQCEHLGSRGDVSIGSHGGASDYGYNFTATIELRNRRSEGVMHPDYLVEKANRSLPHLSVAPLPKADYLMAAAAIIPFRPQDWDV